MNPQTAVINDDVNGTPRELLPVLTKIRKDMRKAAGTLDAREARYLVDLYYQMQENRLRAAGQIRAIQKSETEEPHETLSWFLGQAEILEASIKMALGEFAESRAVGRWSLSICGIGPVIASGLIAHISMNIWRCATSVTNRCRPEAPCSAACRHEPTQTASRIWRYAGLDPSSTWEKGQKRPWNAALKVLCWKAGQSFVKVSNLEKDFYGKLYQQRKRLETERNEAGAVLLLQFGEALGDAAHSFTPKCSATAKMSLSPRPHMFMRMILSFGNCLASFCVKARACAGSNAGMMPSCLAQSWKASSASLSVAET